MRTTRVMAIGAHTDDIELGCGGTIARSVAAGSEVYCVACSSLNNPILIHECVMAMVALGVSPSNVWIGGFPNKLFHTRRQSVFGFIEDAINRIVPDIMYTHCTVDSHQDHRVVTQEAIRIVKHRPITLLGYELLPNTSASSVALPCFTALGAGHVGQKINAVACYDSQKDRPYMQASILLALAMVRGLQAGTELAEAFELIRAVFG